MTNKVKSYNSSICSNHRTIATHKNKLKRKPSAKVKFTIIEAISNCQEAITHSESEKQLLLSQYQLKNFEKMNFSSSHSTNESVRLENIEIENFKKKLFKYLYSSNIKKLLKQLNVRTL